MKPQNHKSQRFQDSVFYRKSNTHKTNRTNKKKTMQTRQTRTQQDTSGIFSHRQTTQDKQDDQYNQDKHKQKDKTIKTNKTRQTGQTRQHRTGPPGSDTPHKTGEYILMYVDRIFWLKHTSAFAQLASPALASWLFVCAAFRQHVGSLSAFADEARH